MAVPPSLACGERRRQKTEHQHPRDRTSNVSQRPQTPSPNRFSEPVQMQQMRSGTGRVDAVLSAE
jgi:hypothetical protein